MQIRDPLPGDVGWIVRVHGEVYAREFSFDRSFEFTTAEKLVRYFSGDDDFNRIWIAEVDGVRAGC